MRCGNQNKMDKTKTDDARKHIPWRYDNTIYLKSSDNSDGLWSELTWFETTVLISKTLWQHFGLSLPNYDIILFNLFPFSPCVLIAHSWMPLDNVLAQGQGSGGITLNPCSKWLSPVKKIIFFSITVLPIEIKRGGDVHCLYFCSDFCLFICSLIF